MNRIISLLTFMVVCLSGFAQSPIEDCKCKGIELYGRVFVVSKYENPDFLVKLGSPYCGNDKIDFYVYKLNDHTVATNCGEWSFVEDRNHSDFTIAYVENETPDFTIQFINGLALEPGPVK